VYYLLRNIYLVFLRLLAYFYKKCEFMLLSALDFMHSFKEIHFILTLNHSIFFLILHL